MKKYLIKSFSLVEVLVFVSILSLFFVAAAAITSVSLRNMKSSEHRIIATHYANELLSWLRSQKETDWPTFYVKASPNVSSPYEYCFNLRAISSVWPSSTCATNDFIPPIYERRVYLSAPTTSQVNVKIMVTWSEFGTTYSVPLTTVLTAWE